jgi:hypothetical protein
MALALLLETKLLLIGYIYIIHSIRTPIRLSECPIRFSECPISLSDGHIISGSQMAHFTEGPVSLSNSIIRLNHFTMLSERGQSVLSGSQKSHQTSIIRFSDGPVRLF